MWMYLMLFPELRMAMRLIMMRLPKMRIEKSVCWIKASKRTKNKRNNDDKKLI